MSYEDDLADIDAEYAAKLDRIDKEYRCKMRIILAQLIASITTAIAWGGGVSYAAAGAISWWFAALIPVATIATYTYMGLSWYGAQVTHP